MSSNRKTTPVSVIGIDIGKNSFHVVGQDQHGAIVLRQKWSRGQVQTRLAPGPYIWVSPTRCASQILGLVFQHLCLSPDTTPLTFHTEA
jgi:hypothetical protein